MPKRGKKSGFSRNQRFQLFVDKLNELLQLRAVKNGLASEYRISLSTSGTITLDASEPDSEDLRSFLLLFRQFIMNDEPINVLRILNDCERYLQDAYLRDELRKARAHWNDIFKGVGIGIVIVNGQQITPEHVMDLWINGELFHSNDSEKSVELKRLQALPVPIDRIQFITILPSLLRVLVYVGNTVAYGLVVRQAQNLG